MRAAIVLFVLLLPIVAGQAGTIAVQREEEGTIRLDTDHLSARIRFRVTNTGSELDYVTIPRQDIRWVESGQTALGFPSPEFGLSLAPGASGSMWAHVDVSEPRVGTATVEVPFQSERTGTKVTSRATIEVAAAPQPAHRLVVRTEPAGARIEVTDLTATNQPEVAGAPDPGGWSAQVRPGRYAVRADLAGYQGATRIVTVPDDGLEVRLALTPARWHVQPSETTSASVGDSAWILAGSEDLTRLVTAPMVHQEPTSRGKFVGLDDAPAWELSFPGVLFPQANAGPFQALDTVAAVSADGARAALFDWNGALHVVDASDGDLLWETSRSDDRNPLYPSASAFGRGFFTSGAVAFSPDGATLVAGGSNGWTVAFDAADGDVLWSRAFSAEVRATRFTHDGSGVIVGSGDWQLHRLRADTGATAWSADDPEFWPFFFLALSDDGALVAAGGKDSVYRVWNASTGDLVREVDVFPAFVTGGGVGSWGGTFSDWGYGVRSFDADGDTTWFRRFKGANAVTTDDGAFTLVGWASEGGADSGLALLDETGTTVWTSPAGMNAACSSTASPFPAKQIKSVLLHEAPARGDTRELRYAAACIGGGVFTGTLAVTAPPPVTPPRVTPPTVSPPASTPPVSPSAPAASPTQGPVATPPVLSTATASPTPLPLWLAFAALALVAMGRKK